MVGYVEKILERWDMDVPADDFVLNINEIINCSKYPTLH